MYDELVALPNNCRLPRERSIVDNPGVQARAGGRGSGAAPVPLAHLGRRAGLVTHQGGLPLHDMHYVASETREGKFLYY
jgi:hypothetical protein